MGILCHMKRLLVESTRGSLVESSHSVSVIVLDHSGAQVAAAGDPDQLTFWRSAAKPFQLLPLLESGGVSHYRLDQEMVALACGSHNAEPGHRRVALRWLERAGVSESALHCGGHPSLWPKLAEEMIREQVTPTPLWSNCSGKHAAFLAQALLHQWPIEGYCERDHPVQQRVAESISRWTDLPSDQLHWGVDGCTAPAVALPLRAMARAWVALGCSTAAAPTLIREAMIAHPEMVGGSERLDTALMKAWSGKLIAKIGADGVYSAALPGLGLGLALKVSDGDMHSASLALVEVLRSLTRRYGRNQEWPLEDVARWVEPPINNTRGVQVGHWQVSGELAF